MAAGVDEHGQRLGSIQVGASLQQLQYLAGWVGGFQGPRLVGRCPRLRVGLTRVLLAAGEWDEQVAWPTSTAATAA